MIISSTVRELTDKRTDRQTDTADNNTPSLDVFKETFVSEQAEMCTWNVELADVRQPAIPATLHQLALVIVWTDAACPGV